MGAMGRFLGVISTEERDNVLRSQEWMMCGGADEPACLVQNAVGMERFEADNDWDAWTDTPWHQFDAALRRFGKARVVRAIKLRAARLNGCSPEQIAALTSPSADKVAV